MITTFKELSDAAFNDGEAEVILTFRDRPGRATLAAVRQPGSIRYTYNGKTVSAAVAHAILDGEVRTRERA